MKLVSYDLDGKWRPGLLSCSTVCDVKTLLESDRSAESAPVDSMKDLLREYGAKLPELSERLVAAVKVRPKAEVGQVEALHLGPPVTDPEKVLCIGLNYNDHIAETGRALPSHPNVFSKFASTLIGPFDEIRCSDITRNLDFECELAIVIGRNCRSVTKDDALDYVAGVTVLNDITARDLQYRGTQWPAAV